MKKNTPHIYIEYREDGKPQRIGPFYTVSIDGYKGVDRIYYQVQTETRDFRRVSIPWYHTIKAITDPGTELPI